MRMEKQGPIWKIPWNYNSQNLGTHWMWEVKERGESRMSQISSLGKKTFSEKYVYGGNNELGLSCFELEMPGLIILRCTPANKKEIKVEILRLCCGTVLCTIISKFPYILSFSNFSLHLLALIKVQVFSVNLDSLESSNIKSDFPQICNAS